MVKRGFYVRLEAKSGQGPALAEFLSSALPLANAEPGTKQWYAVKFDESTFGIFDTFVDEAGRQAHLDGPIAAALMKHGPDLLAKMPTIERHEILAAKV